MRVFLSIFLVIYIFSATELHEFLKLPFLFQHYTEHKKQDKNLSLLSFIKLHYSNENTIYPDHEKDNKLPYKSDDKNIITLTYFPFKKLHFQNLQLPEIKSEKTFPSSFKNFVLEGYHFNIWQPPKNNLV